MTLTTPLPTRKPETLVFADSKGWVWSFLAASLARLHRYPLRLTAAYALIDSWTRITRSPLIIIHWECKQRGGGALVEEIRTIAPDFRCDERIVIVTTNPTQEDVLYLSELGLTRTIHLQANQSSYAKAEKELAQFFALPISAQGDTVSFSGLQALESLPSSLSAEVLASWIERIEKALKTAPKDSATNLDLQACHAFMLGEPAKAEKLWHEATERNHNFLRACHNYVYFLRLSGRLDEAFALLKKLQNRNRLHIARLVSMGEIQVQLGNDEHAVHYFESALTRDRHCSAALNGLAEVYFRKGDLDKSRAFLARSRMAAKIAAQLNTLGIKLVQQEQYVEALELYTKAQYVLPQQEKSPLLFYNIGLCYARWGKGETARHYLEIALVKDPSYDKAQRLLASLRPS